MRVETSGDIDFAQLGKLWRELEQAVHGLSFFQSWSWIGCLGRDRFPDVILLRAYRNDELAGLALCNRAAGRLCLTESGNPLLDSPFIEHNAPLCADDEVAAALLAAAWRVRGTTSLVLGGVSPALLALAGGCSWRRQDRIAPYLDLVGLQAAGGDYLAGRSANTRHQLRRSMRAYGSHGPVRLARAANGAEALAWFERMLPLHTATWQARGDPGAFATDFMRRFHRTLIAEAAPRGEVDMLRVTAGEAEVGFLYNFRLSGVVHAYQSGFDMSLAGQHGKPGLTCHALAVEHALNRGDSRYDFMAGDSRYKRSLASDSLTLVWAEQVRAHSPRAWLARLRRQIRGG